jgi:hypothetical protein
LPPSPDAPLEPLQATAEGESSPTADEKIVASDPDRDAIEKVAAALNDV